MLRPTSIPIFLLTVPVVVYVGIFGMLYFRQDQMIFFPTRMESGVLVPEAETLGFERWFGDDGMFLGWKRTQPGASHSILSFHGNGGNASNRFELATFLGAGPRANLYLMEYPGYGERDGVPSEQSLVAAAVAAVDVVAGKNPGRLWLLGESLGTGVAAAAAGARPDLVDGVVLSTPFNSLVGAAQLHYPWIPVGLLMRHRFDSVRHLSGYRGPVAILIAGQDRTTPPELGQRLAASLKSPNRVWEAPGAGHNDTGLLFGRWAEVAEWLDANAPLRGQ